MKCPYRAKVIYIKSEPVTLSTKDGKIKITLIEHTEYEDCYGDECPFWCDDGTGTTPVCNRVLVEGGDNL